MSGPRRPAQSQQRVKMAVDVIVVDDHADTAEMLDQLLTLDGMLVRVARCCGEALEAARERKPHVLIADLSLPDGSGHEIARTLRMEDPTGATAYVAISGVVDPTWDVVQYFDAYLHKPIDVRLLPDLVRSLAASTTSVRRVARTGA
jgi:DNA-binding response OmpR family regulator